MGGTVDDEMPDGAGADDPEVATPVASSDTLPARRRLPMWSRWLLVVGLMILVVVPLLSGGLSEDGRSRLSTGGSLSLADLGDIVAESSSRQLAGSVTEQVKGHPYVLTFWASWCEPCRDELPALQRIGAERAEDGLVILGVNTQDTKEGGSRLSKELKLTFPSLFDSGGGIARALGVDLMPTTAFIASDGHIVKQARGAMSPAELRSTVTDLLSYEQRLKTGKRSP